MTVALQAHPAGVVLPVRAQPGARQSCVRGVQAGALKVAVTQIAERGKANEAVIEVICDALRLRKSQIALLAGETNQQKKFLVTDITTDELAERIEQALAG
jgi:uncharacterized protein YggU (UPF0235/DUF167 family)